MTATTGSAGTGQPASAYIAPIPPGGAMIVPGVPPAPMVEVVPVSPPGRRVWQPGRWAWNGVQYVWVPGR